MGLGLTKCPECGRTFSGLVGTCPHCGCRPGEYNPERPKLTAIPARCTRCGTMVPAGKTSCPGCGSPAKVVYSIAAEPTEPEDLAEYTPFQIEDARSESRRFTWLFLLLAILLIVLLAFGVTWIDRTVRRNSPPVVIEPTAPTSTVTVGTKQPEGT